MLLVDDREPGYLDRLHQAGVPAEGARLDCADFAFVLPHVTVGIERKAVGDLLRVISDNRFTSEQLPCLATTYGRVYLLVEGKYKRGEGGLLMTPKGKDWRVAQWGRRDGWLYSEVERWLTAREEQGVRLRHTSGPVETVSWLVEAYHEFAKPPEKRRSGTGVYIPTITNPDGTPLLHSPSDTRRVAALMPGIGNEKSAAVADAFEHKFDLIYSAMAAATVPAEAARWLAIPGIGKTTVAKVAKWAVTK
jgi:ERCC4-type nuclease